VEDAHNPAAFFRRPGTTRLQPTPAVHTLASPARTLSSDSIFRGEREIGIERHGALYRLKVTRQGKLILNK
jgi:hemin uptake protein HemP